MPGGELFIFAASSVVDRSARARELSIAPQTPQSGDDAGCRACAGSSGRMAATAIDYGGSYLFFRDTPDNAGAPHAPC